MKVIRGWGLEEGDLDIISDLCDDDLNDLAMFGNVPKWLEWNKEQERKMKVKKIVRELKPRLDEIRKTGVPDDDYDTPIAPGMYPLKQC